MAIPEQQRKTLVDLGAQARSKRTYDSIRDALADHEWPATMGFPNVYLQGSYRNHTNIAGNSDVDVVVESKGMFYADLSDVELRIRGFPVVDGGYCANSPALFALTDATDALGVKRDRIRLLSVGTGAYPGRRRAVMGS